MVLIIGGKGKVGSYLAPLLAAEGFGLINAREEKSRMDRAIAKEFRANGFPGTIVHPGHVVCPGDIPINPRGCKSPEAFRILKKGEAL